MAFFFLIIPRKYPADIVRPLYVEILSNELLPFIILRSVVLYCFRIPRLCHGGIMVIR